MCPRLGRTTPGDYRRPERPGPAPVGLVCRGRLGPQSPSGSADLPRPPGAQTGPGDSRAPAAQPLARAVSPMLTRQGSCAREQCRPPPGGERMRLTPHWTTTGGPAQRRSLRRPVWRQRTPGRLEGLIPCARGRCLDLRSRACCLRRLAPTACGGGAAPAPGAHWTPPRRCAPPVPRTGGGHRDLSRAQHAHKRVAARGAQPARAPQDVWGAATQGLRRPPAIQSAHDTVC